MKSLPTIERLHELLELRDGKLYYKVSKNRDMVEKWLTDKRTELHGEFANHGRSDVI